MLALDSTLKSLEVILGGAVTTNQLPWTVTYDDVNQNTLSMQAVTENDGLTNSVTAIAMIAAPAGNISRQIKFLSITNLDTVQSTVTIRVNNNGTFRTIFKGILAVNDILNFTDSRGFYVTDSAGNLKVNFGFGDPLTAAHGGTGIANTGTLTNVANTTITGGGTIALGGFTVTIPATGTSALLNQSNSFTLINPLITIAESWIGPSSTTGIYFKGGFVGIGTITPGQQLEVVNGNIRINGNDQVRARLQLNNSGISGREYALISGIANVGQVGFSIHDITANVTRLVISDSGNLGFGSITPSFPFSFATSSDSFLFAIGSVDAALTGKRLKLGYLSVTDVGAIQAVDEGVINKPLVLNAAGGNVGIATTNPLALFSVGSSSQFRVNASGVVVQYNNISTVSGGTPSEYATIDTTGLTANVAASTLYPVPASGAGMYRISAYVVETVVGSISSTLPNVQIIYTDPDTNTSITIDATPILGIAGIGQTGALTANTIGTASSGVIVINVKASTTIQYQTVNYASNLAGMTYALHIKLEAL